MPFAVYILHSAKLDRYYVGHSEDPDARLARDHNGGRNASTRGGAPWDRKWLRWCATRAEAMALERAIKARKSRAYIERLMASDSGHGGSAG